MRRVRPAKAVLSAIKRAWVLMPRREAEDALDATWRSVRAWPKHLRDVKDERT